MRGARLPSPTMSLLAELLGLCDLVKFAKHLPGREETKGSVERAYRLVDETRRAAPPAVPGAEGEGAAGSGASGGDAAGAGPAAAPPGPLRSRGVA